MSTTASNSTKAMLRASRGFTAPSLTVLGEWCWRRCLRDNEDEGRDRATQPDCQNSTMVHTRAFDCPSRTGNNPPDIYRYAPNRVKYTSYLPRLPKQITDVFPDCSQSAVLLTSHRLMKHGILCAAAKDWRAGDACHKAHFQA